MILAIRSMEVILKRGRGRVFDDVVMATNTYATL